jgi:RNA polymerase sigma-70 factor (ECF subfamily)
MGHDQRIKDGEARMPVNVDESRASGSPGDDWEQRFRELLPRVYRYFAYRVGDGRAAEDLTGDTFERAWRGRGRYREARGAWHDWVFGIAHNVAVDYFRKQRGELRGIERTLPNSSRPTEEALERRADFERISALLSRRADRERELIALKYGADLTNRAIARLTGLSESNVGTILHRLVTELRREWEG